MLHTHHNFIVRIMLAATLCAVALVGISSCAPKSSGSASSKNDDVSFVSVADKSAESLSATSASAQSASSASASASSSSASASASSASASAASQESQDAEKKSDEAESPDNGADEQADEPEPEEPSNYVVDIDIAQDFRGDFCHGPKTAAYQKYIVLHDTEGDSDPESVIDWWDSNGNLVAAHFVVGKDGTIYQCVPMDEIAHHAGYGDTGHNDYYGIVEDGRDDMEGTTPIGDWASDYGMNAWSIGIEMVHVGGSGYYPEAQLEALDALIAYIDDYYGFESEIIDHKAWRSGNSDTSPEFAGYFANYQDHRTHD